MKRATFAKLAPVYNNYLPNVSIARLKSCDQILASYWFQWNSKNDTSITFPSQVSVPEDRSRQERGEEDALLGEIMKTEVIKKTLSFLQATKLFTKSAAEFRKLLAELWFSVYRYSSMSKKVGQH